MTPPGSIRRIRWLPVSATMRLPSGATTRKRGWSRSAAVAGPPSPPEAGPARAGHGGDQAGGLVDHPDAVVGAVGDVDAVPGCRRRTPWGMSRLAETAGLPSPSAPARPVPATTVTRPVVGSSRLIWWWPVSVNQIDPGAVDGGGAGGGQVGRQAVRRAADTLTGDGGDDGRVGAHSRPEPARQRPGRRRQRDHQHEPPGSAHRSGSEGVRWHGRGIAGRFGRFDPFWIRPVLSEPLRAFVSISRKFSSRPSARRQSGRATAPGAGPGAVVGVSLIRVGPEPRGA